MSLAFCPLASGSKGNAYVLVSDHAKILIDAGVSARNIKDLLAEMDISPESLDGILVTHEHSDHIAGIRVLSRSYDIPVYANEPTMGEILRKYCDLVPRNVRTFRTGENFYIKDIDISPFSTPHDSVASVGYCLYSGKHKVTVATDLGHMNQRILTAAANSDVLVLESNHDLNMLINGGYPQMLKRRIQGKYGHLSNEACGRTLVELCRGYIGRVVLAHLSEENNTPKLAYQTVCDILEADGIIAGKDIRIEIAQQRQRGSCYILK